MAKQFLMTINHIVWDDPKLLTEAVMESPTMRWKDKKNYSHVGIALKPLSGNRLYVFDYNDSKTYKIKLEQVTFIEKICNGHSI
jgi:hypothetical protein